VGLTLLWAALALSALVPLMLQCDTALQTWQAEWHNNASRWQSQKQHTLGHQAGSKLFE
jgi:hypothetical protein